MNDAVCREVGSELFFPENGENHLQALAICRRCPVTAECLEHALHLEQAGVWNVTGIWGGVTAKERLRILRERRTRSRVA